MSLNNSVGLFTLVKHGDRNPSKRVTTNQVLFYFALVMMWILVSPFTSIITSALMGYDQLLSILGIYVLLAFGLILLAITKNRYNYLMASLITVVYSFLTGYILFGFLPAMRDLARSYEAVEQDSVSSSTHGFDPSTVDFIFYEQLLIITFIFFIIASIIFGIGMARKYYMEKKTKFKIVE